MISQCNFHDSDPPVLVLAGGFGTRLQGIIRDTVKPLAPIAGRPFLSFLIDEWALSGAKNFIFLLHHKAFQIEDFLNKYCKNIPKDNFNYMCLREPDPRGTGGAISFAKSQISLPDEVIIVNADTWLPGSINMLLNAKANCIVANRVIDASRFGLLIVDDDVVIGFKEKDSIRIHGLINGGAYRLETNLFNNKLSDISYSLETSILSSLAQRKKLKYIVSNEDFIDIGIPEDYHRFNKWVSGGMYGKI